MVEIIASLVFDSWAEELPELRSANIEDRHLIYEGEGLILDLLLKHGKDGTCIHVGGQVLPGDAARQTVADMRVFMEQGKRRAETHTNALGEFTFHSVPNGTLDLAIVLENRRFVVRGLTNKEPRMWRVVHSMAAGGA